VKHPTRNFQSKYLIILAINSISV